MPHLSPWSAPFRAFSWVRPFQPMRLAWLGCLALGSFLMLTTPALAHPAECSSTIPEKAEMTQGAATTYGADSVWVVCRGTSLSVFGDGNRVFVASGGAATIVGSDNQVYAASGAALVLPGADNVVLTTTGASVQDLSGENRRHPCAALHLDATHFDAARCGFDPTGPKASAADGLSKAGDGLLDLAELARNLADGIIHDAPADATNRLIGTWTVAGVRLDGEVQKAQGKIVLYPSGYGAQSYRVNLGGHELPQLGAFSWRSDQRRVYVDDELVWTRRVDRPDHQEVELELPSGPRIVLILERRPVK